MITPFADTLGISGAAATAYLVSVLGSISVELVALLRDIAGNDGHLPARYRHFAYPIVRLLVALLVAGPLAIFMGPETALNAFYIGAAAPLIVDRLAAGINKPIS